MASQKQKKILIIGSGTFGTAVATSLAYAHRNAVVVYGIDQTEINAINNKKYQNQKDQTIIFSNQIFATSSLSQAIQNVSLILVAVPGFAVQNVLTQIKLQATNKISLVFLTKGVNQNAVKFDDLFFYNTTQQLIKQSRFINDFGFLYGPNIAAEIKAQAPAFATFASTSQKLSEHVKAIFAKTNIHLEISQNPIGANYCAVFKNVIAIWAGIWQAFLNSDSTTAAMICQAWQQLGHFFAYKKIKTNILLSFAGMGDLILTCKSPKSRNFSFGYLIGTTLDVEKTKKKYNKLVEGYFSCHLLCQHLTKIEKANIPFLEVLHAVLFEKKPVDYIKVYLTQPHGLHQKLENK